ncbi:MAG: PadR family transcriptional regulator [Planctomycetota bacterium]
MSNWHTQLRKGLVELAVLASLRSAPDGEAYGYELLQRINRDERFQLTESTVYPLLAKLARSNLVAVRIGPSPNGPPRRYYRLTKAGQRHLDDMTAHWKELNASIQRLLDGDSP